MGRAVVLTSVSKSSLTGGTFADTLTANPTDSTTVNYFPDGQANIVEMWGIDSASVAELQIISTKPESTHDQQHGIRFSIPALVPGGAGAVAGHNLLGGYGRIRVYPSDTLTPSVSGTAADAVLVSWQTLYDDLPGVQASFATPAQCEALRKSTVGIRVSAVASATKGSYGTARAFNTDDDRLHGLTWYAIAGFTVQTQATTVSLIGPDWGGQRIGGPGGVLTLDQSAWFFDQSIKWNTPLVPVFNSSNKANIFVQVADGQANTSPQIDFLLYELTGAPF